MDEQSENTAKLDEQKMKLTKQEASAIADELEADYIWQHKVNLRHSLLWARIVSMLPVGPMSLRAVRNFEDALLKEFKRRGVFVTGC